MKKQSVLKAAAAIILGISFILPVAACNKDKAEAPSSVTVGITQEPGLFDPHLAVAAGDKEILFNIFEGLYKFSSDGTLNPALATNCTVSDDCKEFTFDLRKDVKFHDGSVMTADDVVYSIERAKENIQTLGTISGIEKLSEDQVKITLSIANSEFLSQATFAIIPKSVSDINANPVGTGPFKFKEYLVGQSVTIVKNEDYWNDSLPYLDEVVFKICADMDSGLLELQNGSIDIFPHMTKDKAEMAGDNFTMVTGSSNMIQIFALNNAVAPFDNVKVREALNYAVNKDDIIDLTMDGAGTKLTTGMNPVIGKAYDTSLDSTYSQDIEKAKSLLKEAGYENGFDMTITVPSNYLVHVNTAEVIADQLKDIGVNAQIEQIDWSTWLSDVYSGRDYQSTVICLTPIYAPMDEIARYHSESTDNFINYKNSEVDRIIDSIPTTLDENERVELYHQLLGILVADNCSVYIQDPMEITVVKNDIEGYKLYPMYIQDMSEVKYKES